MALLRTISRISLVVSAALGAWRLWQTWHDRHQATPGSTASASEA